MIRFKYKKVGLNILINQSTTVNCFFNYNAIIFEYHKTNKIVFKKNLQINSIQNICITILYSMSTLVKIHHLKKTQTLLLYCTYLKTSQLIYPKEFILLK